MGRVQGEGGREKSQEMGETRRAGWEKRRAGKTVDASRRQRQVGSGAVGTEKKHAACCTTLIAHHFHFHPKKVGGPDELGWQDRVWRPGVSGDLATIDGLRIRARPVNLVMPVALW